MPIKFVPDELELLGARRRYSGDVSPADFVVSRQLDDDPLVAAEIDDMVNDAELLGIDLDDPEIMGAWLKNLVNKIKKAVKKKKGKMKGVSIQTESGTTSIGPTGINYQSNIPVSSASMLPAPSGISEMVKNPMVIAAGIGLLAMLAMSKKGRGKR